MMIRKWTGAAIVAVALTGCASMAEGPDTSDPVSDGACQAEGVQSLIGQTVNEALGTRLLRDSGATTLRWAPPRSMLTMDFRPDRLTVAYDDDYRVTTISCG
jgi:hypothetical protein